MPASGNISVNIYKSQQGSPVTGGASPAAGQKPPSGTQSQPIFVNAAIPLMKVLNPLLLLYSIDRTMRAAGFTSNVMQGFIRAIGAIFSAIIDTMLIQLLPEFGKLIDISMKLYDWVRTNWPRIIEQIRGILEPIGRISRGEGPISNVGEAVRRFSESDTATKLTLGGLAGITGKFLLDKTAGIRDLIMKASGFLSPAGALGRFLGTTPLIGGALRFAGPIAAGVGGIYSASQIPQTQGLDRILNVLGTVVSGAVAGGAIGSLAAPGAGTAIGAIGGGIAGAGAALTLNNIGSQTVTTNLQASNISDIDRIGSAISKAQQTLQNMNYGLGQQGWNQVRP